MSVEKNEITFKVSHLCLWEQQAASWRHAWLGGLCWCSCPSPPQCQARSSSHSGSWLSRFWDQCSVLERIFLQTANEHQFSIFYILSSSLFSFLCWAGVSVHASSPVWMAHSLNRHASLSSSQPCRAACFHGIENIFLSCNKHKKRWLRERSSSK